MVEWWRKGHRQPSILALGTVEPLNEAIAKASGEALAKVRGSTAIDATIRASAAQRGDRVFTSNPTNMQRLQRHFRAVADITPV
jgi:hypothetical protein